MARKLTDEEIEQIRRREGTVVFNAADLFATYDALKEDHEASLMAANSLGDELRRVRADIRDKACKVNCIFCKDGVPYDPDLGMHTNRYHCKSKLIREMV